MAGHDVTNDGWHKSTTSNADCVEVRIAAGEVHVRDSKDRGRPALTFTHTEWNAFLDGVRRGEFELTE